MAAAWSRAHHSAFRTHFKVLEAVVTDPGDLATSLWAEELIDKLACEKATSLSSTPLERSRELLLKLEGKIREEKEAFNKFLAILDRDPTKKDICSRLRTAKEEAFEVIFTSEESGKHTQSVLSCHHCWPILLLGTSALFILALAILWSNTDICYHLGTCNSKSLPSSDHFVGREEDIRNITGYLDFNSSNVQVVHIVGPPGFGKSTLAIKIGNVFLRKGVKVHYVDIQSVSDIDTLAEKVMLSIVESINYKVTFDRVVRWVRDQYIKTLIILDNCDELLEKRKHEFIEGINSLLAFSKRNVKYLLTSQQWVADIGNFQLHAIYNLSSEASIQLLDRLAPSLTNKEKMEIATLTGNVPLALAVVGAIFTYPNAPSAEEVMQGLRENPVNTLSPSHLHSTVDVSIGLAYSYLTPELQMLCVNLSYFPGTFSRESALFIIGLEGLFRNPLDTLVQRSLLQYNSASRRYHFHQLIRKYFLQVNDTELILHEFETNFQAYFSNTLLRVVNNSLPLTVLDDDKHNFKYMFTLFKTAKDINNTFFGIRVTMKAIKLKVLQSRFTPEEVYNITEDMLTVLETYTPEEEASVELFLDTYTKVVIELAEQQRLQHRKADIPIETLSLRRKKVNEGYGKELISMNTFTTFYTLLAQYYEENREWKKAHRCHVQILAKTHDQLEHCYPHCDYYSISVAYEKTGERVQAFKFRELAYKHQLEFLNLMKQAKLYMDLYNDYSDTMLGNDTSKASELSNVINEYVYTFLLIDNNSDYMEDVYYSAIDYFKSKNLDDKVISLEITLCNRIIDSYAINFKEHCNGGLKMLECGTDIFLSANTAWKRQCYILVVQLGELSFRIFDKLQNISTNMFYKHLALYSAILVGKGFYAMGNYSDSQIWLRRALELVNKCLKEDYSLKLREERVTVCSYLIMMGDMWFYGYIIKDGLTFVANNAIENMHITYNFKSQPVREVLNTTGEVIEQRYSYIWSFVYNFQCKVKKHWSSMEWKLNNFLSDYSFTINVINIVLWFIVLPYMVTMCIIMYLPYCLFPCHKQYAACCIPCLTLYIFFSFVLTISVFLHILCLDWLY